MGSLLRRAVATTVGRGAASLAAAASRGARRQFSNVEGENKLKQLLQDHAARAAPVEGEAGRAAAEGAAAMEAENGLGAKIGNMITLGGLAASAYFGYYTYNYTADELDGNMQKRKEEEPSLPVEGWIAMMEAYVGLRRKVEGWVQDYANPPTDKLLPDIPPHAIYPRFTVVLDLNETLVHSDWTRGRGWRVFKRPGMEDFIKQLSPNVELVVFTDQLSTYAEPILERIDPERNIRFRLYRDSTQYHNGKHVRDLSKLNRNLNQVIFISSDPDAFLFQPDNAVKISPWKLEEGDTVLLDLLPFIELIVKTDVADVRDVMRSYKGQDIPTAFRKRMEELANRRKQQAPHGFLGIQLR